VYLVILGDLNFGFQGIIPEGLSDALFEVPISNRLIYLSEGIPDSMLRENV
jgi:uncharacterized membrane protein YuzA (DUF378 family)